MIAEGRERLLHIDRTWRDRREGWGRGKIAKRGRSKQIERGEEKKKRRRKKKQLKMIVAVKTQILSKRIRGTA